MIDSCFFCLTYQTFLIMPFIVPFIGCQCFDTFVWVTGRASGQ